MLIQFSDENSEKFIFFFFSSSQYSKEYSIVFAILTCKYFQHIICNFLFNISIVCLSRRFYVCVIMEKYESIFISMFRHADTVFLLVHCYNVSLLNSLQLDIRTKLCIRDSLYRLAKSAEQRHNCAISSASIGVDRDASDAVMAEETNKYVIRLIFDSHLFLFLFTIHGMIFSILACEERYVQSHPFTTIWEDKSLGFVSFYSKLMVDIWAYMSTLIKYIYGITIFVVISCQQISLCLETWRTKLLHY